MIRWLMLGLLLFSESACDRNKNAVSNRIDSQGGKIKAAADEDDIYPLTCYTCVNVSDNKMCNEWAIDTPCPAGGRDFCRSLHILDSRGQSVLVNKSCVSKIECSPASVGCMPIDTQKICISCCDTSYCNVESPTNASNATFSRKRVWLSSRQPSKQSREDDEDDEADAEDIGDDQHHEQGGPSSAGRRLGQLASAHLAQAFSAICVFLNRAYH